jgi:hypothetical protein
MISENKIQVLGHVACSSKADTHDIASYLVHLLSAVRVGPTAEQQQ